MRLPEPTAMRAFPIVALAALLACAPASAQTRQNDSTTDRPSGDGTVVDGQEYSGAIPVEVRQDADGSWTLLRGGEPYYIRGVGGNTFLDRAVAAGANSIRTWGAGEAIGVLDAAHERGLSVVFGLWAGQERQGFDYGDGRAVKAQLERFREVVKAYKDHPRDPDVGAGQRERPVLLGPAGLGRLGRHRRDDP